MTDINLLPKDLQSKHTFKSPKRPPEKEIVFTHGTKEGIKTDQKENILNKEEEKQKVHVVSLDKKEVASRQNVPKQASKKQESFFLRIWKRLTSDIRIKPRSHQIKVIGKPIHEMKKQFPDMPLPKIEDHFDTLTPFYDEYEKETARKEKKEAEVKMKERKSLEMSLHIPKLKSANSDQRSEKKEVLYSREKAIPIAKTLPQKKSDWFGKFIQWITTLRPARKKVLIIGKTFTRQESTNKQVLHSHNELPPTRVLQEQMQSENKEEKEKKEEAKLNVPPLLQSLEQRSVAQGNEQNQRTKEETGKAEIALQKKDVITTFKKGLIGLFWRKKKEKMESLNVELLTEEIVGLPNPKPYLFLIGVIAGFIVAVGIGIRYFYYYQTRQLIITNIQEEKRLAILNEAIVSLRQKEKSFSQAVTIIETIDALLERRVNWLDVLEKIESLTLRSVYFTDMRFDKGGIVVVKLRVQTLEDALLQIKILQSEKDFVKEVKTENINVAEREITRITNPGSTTQEKSEIFTVTYIDVPITLTINESWFQRND